MKYKILSDDIVSKPYEISYRQIVLDLDGKKVKFLVDRAYWDESFENKEKAIFLAIQRKIHVY